MLTAPFTPMLFMGEEWGADTPWQFFTDHTDPFFAEAVSTGRRSEFAKHGWGFAEVPDPQDKETFLRSKLDWAQPAREPYRSLLGWYRVLLALRRSRPELTDPRLHEVRAAYDEAARWLLMSRGPLRIAANLGADPVEIPLGAPAATLLAASNSDISLKSGAISLPPASFAVVGAASGSEWAVRHTHVCLLADIIAVRRRQPWRQGWGWPCQPRRRRVAATIAALSQARSVYLHGAEPVGLRRIDGEVEVIAALILTHLIVLVVGRSVEFHADAVVGVPVVLVMSLVADGPACLALRLGQSMCTLDVARIPALKREVRAFVGVGQRLA